MDIFTFLWSHARRDIEIKKKTFELEQYETTKLDTPCHYPFGSIFFFWSLVSRSELDLDVDSHSVGKKIQKLLGFLRVYRMKTYSFYSWRSTDLLRKKYALNEESWGLKELRISLVTTKAVSITVS